MDARLILEYIKATAWPIVAGLAMWRYREVFENLLRGAKVTLKIFDQSIEKTIPQMESFVADILEGERPDEHQMALLRKLQGRGPVPFDKKDEAGSRKLRNFGLIRSYPIGTQLADAQYVSISPIGKLVVDANKICSP